MFLQSVEAQREDSLLTFASASQVAYSYIVITVFLFVLRGPWRPEALDLTPESLCIKALLHTAGAKSFHQPGPLFSLVNVNARFAYLIHVV